MTDYKNLIDGKMVDNGQWLEVLNPATEQVVGRVPSCGKEELDSAVAAARRAFIQWKKTTAEERQQVVQGIAAAIKENENLVRCAVIDLCFKHGPQQQKQDEDECCCPKGCENYSPVECSGKTAVGPPGDGYGTQYH